MEYLWSVASLSLGLALFCWREGSSGSSKSACSLVRTTPELEEDITAAALPKIKFYMRVRMRILELKAAVLLMHS